MADHYISKEAALAVVCWRCDAVHPDERELCPYKFAGCTTYYDIFELPVADVEAVVRCEDCMFAKHSPGAISYWCREQRHTGDFYCADGRKKVEP